MYRVGVFCSLHTEESVEFGRLGVLAPGTYDLDVEMLFTSVSQIPGFPATRSLGHRSMTFTVVPKPTSAFLLGVGPALLATRRREANPADH